MRLEIKGLSELRDHLTKLRPAEFMAQGLTDEAERMAQAVRSGLSEPQGGSDHDRPWIRVGALHDSVAATTNGLEAAIGSNDPAAALQEMGTSQIPPRPFLAPVAASMGEEAARAIGQQVASALRGDFGPSTSATKAAVNSIGTSDLMAPPKRFRQLHQT